MWKEIIDGLLKAGRTERQLAGEVGCTQPTINRLRNGKTDQPTWPVGRRLMELSGRECACTATAVHDNQEAA
jgi:transcriptional regulator with XRE-family HTH domain